MVISTTVTPPSASAAHASTSCSLSGERTTATMPQSRTRRRGSSLLMEKVCMPQAHGLQPVSLPLLLLDERLRFDDGVLVGEGVEGADEQAAGAGLDRDQAERRQGQAVVRVEVV